MTATRPPPTTAVVTAFDDVFGAEPLPAAPASGREAWPETADAAVRIRDALAEGRFPDATLFDPCVDQDSPLPRRAAAIAGAVERMGGVDEIGELEFPSPAQASWTLRGPRGELRCGILMTPLADTRVQKLDAVASNRRESSLRGR